MRTDNADVHVKTEPLLLEYEDNKTIFQRGQLK